GGPPGRERAPAADPHDGLRHDRGHGADGPGAGAGEPDGGPARPGRDRRTGDVDVRHSVGPALDLRAVDREQAARLALTLSGQPRERALRPGARRPPGRGRPGWFGDGGRWGRAWPAERGFTRRSGPG